MLLNYNFHENFINSENSQNSESNHFTEKSHPSNNSEINFHLISNKIKIPKSKGIIERTRLYEILKKFSERFGATLINGRAGTGKTTLAADFAKNYEKVAWYRIDSTDSQWEIFARYFLSAIKKSCKGFKNKDFTELICGSSRAEVQKFVEITLIELEKLCKENPILIVLDDLHNIYDTNWFEAFFHELLAYNVENISILLLSRTQPPFPIWRLRSKQKLGYLDEKLLLFTKQEFNELITEKGINSEKAGKIYQSSFGRISKLIEFADLNVIKA